MRLYCLDMLDLDMLLAIRPLGNHVSRSAKYAADITAQLASVPKSGPPDNKGIDSGVLEKVHQLS